MKMWWGLLRATLIFPVNNFIVIPGILLWWTRGGEAMWQVASPEGPAFWIAVAKLLAGASLMLWTVALFVNTGHGTPNPAEPPKSLVVRGPYRYCRNPMMLGGVVALLGEALFFGSWAIAGWACVYAGLYALYGLLFEEPGLESRFGRDYTEYKRHVPRWLPRPTPWQPER